ncbi:MAG: glycogen synthase [Bacteroidota bacterium]
MKIAILTNEYPPHIYGGAGVHVEYLTRELVRQEGEHEVMVRAFGDQDVTEGRLQVQGVQAAMKPAVQDERHGKVMNALVRNLAMAGSLPGADIVHGHTWYSHWAACLAKQLYGSKLVLTTHSLEPHRPWKVEQLGTGYQATRWIEQTAYQNADGVIAVSAAMGADVRELYGVPKARIRVIPNGIDLDQYRPTHDESVLRRHGIDPERPFVLFVGRITRQKGILHLVRAIEHLAEGTQIVLCAGAPDTEEIEREMTALVDDARARGTHRIIWIPEMMPREDVIVLYSHAAVFACPSVYEPFGIINLEAMACETPVVASAVGGIPEIIIDGETGLLIPLEARGHADFEPKDPEAFAHALAEGLNRILGDDELRARMAHASRARVEAEYGWNRIAERTLAFYESLL